MAEKKESKDKKVFSLIVRDNVREEGKKEKIEKLAINRDMTRIDSGEFEAPEEPEKEDPSSQNPKDDK